MTFILFNFRFLISMTREVDICYDFLVISFYVLTTIIQMQVHTYNSFNF